MIRDSSQLGLDLHGAPETPYPVDPKTLRRQSVRDLKPAAPDGDAFFLAFLSAVRDVASENGGEFFPAQVRERCRTLGVKPPHPNHWGSAWAKLEAAGYRRTNEETASRTVERNAAKECRWVAPEVQS